MANPIVPTPDTTDNLKRCSKCHECKPREAFGRDHARRDGLQRLCKACKSVYNADNTERDRQRSAEYYAANRERLKERRRKYNAANPTLIAEQLRQYRQTDAGKEVRRAAKHNRRAREAGASGTYTTAEIAAIRAAQTDKHGQLRCWRCGKPIKGTPHLDHWTPLAKGGANDAGNLHYMHAKCNLSKGAKLPTELGRLL